MLFRTNWSPIDKAIDSHRMAVKTLQGGCTGETSVMNDSDGSMSDFPVGTWLKFPRPANRVAQTAAKSPPAPSIAKTVHVDKEASKMVLETRSGESMTVPIDEKTRVRKLGRVSQWREQAAYLRLSLAENTSLRLALRRQIKGPYLLLRRQRVRWSLQALAVGGILLGYGLLWPPTAAVRLLLWLIRAALRSGALCGHLAWACVVGLGECLTKAWRRMSGFGRGGKRHTRSKATRR